MSARDKLEEAVKACYSTWSENYHRDYCSDAAAYPPVHYGLFRNILAQAKAKNVLDAGCGPASFLRELAKEPLELYGFDLTPEMIDEGRRVFGSLNLPPERLWVGSVLDPKAFAAPDGPGPGGFDAAICAGVLPHIPKESDAAVLANLHAALRPGGVVAVEARNALFSLFTLNRYSQEFFLREFIQAQALAKRLSDAENAALTQALAELEERFRMDLPPVRGGSNGSPGYDEVLSRTHNPLEMRAQFEAAGFTDVRLLFYHYHCLPPMFAATFGEAFQRESLAMEKPDDWRGHFMASAFIVTGRRA